jgi:repressor of nif and glnA expression
MRAIFINQDDIERKIILILRILYEAQAPVGARLIARRMQELGIASSERTVRYHLKFMDERGLTKLVGRRDGRIITEAGIDEIGNARVKDKVGMAISRIEILSFNTTFNPDKGQGLLPVNVSLFKKEEFPEALRYMAPVFKSGFVVSERVAVAQEGNLLGNVVVPVGKIGIATVCSIVTNGVLLKHGIPMDSKFGGILQVKNRKPLRFVELISYAGSSLDPSEAFIRAQMTSVKNAAQTGEGMILANFREIPALCYPLMDDLLKKMKKSGINGVLITGEISEPICQIHVDINKMGVILIGGLNPVACAQEVGICAENRGMASVMEYEDLVPFKDVKTQFGTHR